MKVQSLNLPSAHEIETMCEVVVCNNKNGINIHHIDINDLVVRTGDERSEDFISLFGLY